MSPAIKFQDLLGPFSDPATEVVTDDTATSTRVQLTRDGDRRTYVLDKSSSKITARNDASRAFASSASLVASSDFADLRAMAATQQRVLETIHRAPFIEPNLQINTHTGIHALSSTLDSPLNGTTRIILLDGPAGIGKTRLLERLTFERATMYLQGSGRPMLYVGSRGRRLSNLPDTLAAATQTLRTRFTFEHVPLLVRMGLLDLAIDGFDELVDADGYQDAWHALRDFIGQLNGGGTCILAGRDTFFDQQGFLNRLNENKTKVDLVEAHLMPVPVDAARTWLAEAGWPPSDIEEVTERLRSNAYLRRPYFLSQLAELHDWSEVGTESARSFLVARFIGRESRIISRSVDISDDNARCGVAELLQLVALDMAERESDEVDVEYLALLCELTFERWLTRDDVRKLQHKAGSTGLLELAASPKLRRFPHSEIQHHFLAQGILSALAGEQIPLVLRRGVLGTDFLETLEEVAEAFDQSGLRRGLHFLKRMAEREVGADRLISNAGSILLTLMSIPNDELPSHVTSMQISECSFSGTPRRSRISNCTVFRLDARGADLRAISFERSNVTILVGDSLTVFGLSAPAIGTVHDTEATGGRALRSPTEIRDWLVGHGWSASDQESAEESVRHPFEEYFERVIRRSLHQFYFRKNADDLSSGLLRHEWWPEVESILDSEGRLKRATKPMGGTRADLLHIRSPRDLLDRAAHDDGATRIWERVRERAQHLTLG